MIKITHIFSIQSPHAHSRLEEDSLKSVWSQTFSFWRCYWCKKNTINAKIILRKGGGKKIKKTDEYEYFYHQSKDIEVHIS